MTTLVLILTLIALIGCFLVIAGLVLLAASTTRPEPEFARFRNGYLPPLGQRKPR